MKNIIFTSITFIISLIMFIISFCSFKQKGFLFNNAYIYASKKERETLDKKPYYKQSAIAFLLLGLMFLIISIDMLLNIKWLFYVEMICAFTLVIYAIVSSIMIEKKNNIPK